MLKRKSIIFLVAAAVLLLSVAGFAASHLEKIEAYRSLDMNFSVDGENWHPMETDGSKLVPIVYNGRTYVPARALLEERGVKVGYNNDTKTVILDYPIKELDKSTPLLYQRSKNGSTETLEISLNKELDARPFSGSSEIEIELEEDAVITLNGHDISINELLASDEPLKMDYGKILVTYDPQKSTAASVRIDEDTVPEMFAAKVDVKIEITYPPFKITITIRW